ncbi:glycosyl transferase family 1, partial [Limnoraphis robusta]|nr:glycosyl transferase family 1 [Limnoraphis robusta]
IADRVDEVLDHPNRMADLRVRARETVLERYDLSKLLSKQLQLIEQVAQKSQPTSGEQISSQPVIA